MAQNDDAVLVAAVGYVFTGPVGTAAPTPSALATLDLTTTTGWTPAGWKPVGHTSRNKMPEFGFDGGKTAIRGTWQNAKLREVVSETPADFVTVHLHQLDEEAMELYYGANSSVTPGIFGVSGDLAVHERAFLIVIVDGDERLGFWASKAAVKRDAAIDLPVDDFAVLPIKATFLKDGTKNLYEWINEDMFNVS